MLRLLDSEVLQKKNDKKIGIPFFVKFSIGYDDFNGLEDDQKLYLIEHYQNPSNKITLFLVWITALIVGFLMTFIIKIVLFNLIIAMMSETYEKVVENDDGQKWSYYHAKFFFFFTNLFSQKLRFTKNFLDKILGCNSKK